MRLTELRPEFVEYIPEELKPGILYVSEKYGTAVHLCPCGRPECGRHVAMALKPDWDNGWIYERRGDEVSMSPSVGNFQLPCRSHYYIKANKIEWL